MSKALGTGKSALLADIDESWTAPLDRWMADLDPTVHRRPRYDVIENQMACESAAYRAEIDLLKRDLATARAEDKAAIQKQIDAAKAKLQAQCALESRRGGWKRADARISAPRSCVGAVGRAGDESL